ncbi:solute carrier family 22 member 4-like [Haemaphysalis longicornis]
MQEISDVLGPPRLYHFAVLALIFVRAFPSSWTQFTAVFIATDVEHWCSKPHHSSLTNWTEEQWKEHAIPTVNNSSLSSVPVFHSCRMFPLVESSDNGSDVTFDHSRTVPCEEWSYNESSSESSAVPEWDLVCQHEWQRSMMTSVVFFGSLVGALLMGHLSDRFGRRAVFFGSVFCVALFGAVSALSASVHLYNALRFFTCIGIAGTQTSSVALIAEILDPRYRTFLNLGYTAGFAIPTLLLPGVAYVLGNWKLLQLVSALSVLACLPFMLVIQESPRWLITTNQEEKAERAIYKILKMNRRVVPDLKSVVHGLVVEVRESSTLAVGPLEIFKHRIIRRNMVLLFVVWFCDNFIMFAVVLGSADIKGSSYVNFAVSTAAEIPAAFVGLGLVYYCRRRPSQVAALLLAATAAVAAQFSYSGIPYLSLSMSMAGRFFLVLSGSVKWVWTTELFPTAARGFGFAACFTMGRIGGILAPFISHLNKHAPLTVSSALLALAGIAGAATAAMLPETRGVELPDTFMEAESIALKRTK